MKEYQKEIRDYLGIKNTPSEGEILLFQKTQKYIPYIAWIPGLKMVAICNSLSMYAADGESDIDLFIVSAPKRLWLVRFLVTLIFQILGVRRHGNRVAGRFCLSFYASENALDFKTFAIENDIYLSTWIQCLKPILDINGTYEKFLKINSWVDIDMKETAENMKYTTQKTTKESSSKMFDAIDAFWYWLYQALYRHISAHYHTIKTPFGVIINRDMLKLHDNDRRMEVRDAILKGN